MRCMPQLKNNFWRALARPTTRPPQHSVSAPSSCALRVLTDQPTDREREGGREKERGGREKVETREAAATATALAFLERARSHSIARAN